MPYSVEETRQTKDMTLDDIETALIQKDARCCTCGKQYKKGNIQTYPHSGGIQVKGLDGLQWVYMHCDHCEYDSALWKLTNQIKRRES